MAFAILGEVMKPAVWSAALAAGLAMAGAAQAADYAVFKVGEYFGFVDLAGITRKGDMARGTVTRIWPHDEDVGSGPFRYLVTDEEFNCSTTISRNHTLKGYSRAHAMVFQSDELSDPLNPVSAGTMGHDVMRTLCEPQAAVGQRQSAPDRAALVDRLIAD